VGKTIVFFIIKNERGNEMEKFKDIGTALDQKGTAPTIAVIGFPEKQLDYIHDSVDRNVTKCIITEVFRQSLFLLIFFLMRELKKIPKK